MDSGFGEMLDTSPANRARYFSLLRELSPLQRGEIVTRLNRTVRALALTEIRKQHPAASARELDTRLAIRLYGPELARRVYGALPEDPP